MCKSNPVYSASAETPYFVYDSLNNEFSYFATGKERDIHAEFIISEYLDDAWDEEVTNVVAGKITATAAMVDVQNQVGEIDADGLDEAGEWWPDCDYKCNYKLMPLDYSPPKIN